MVEVVAMTIDLSDVITWVIDTDMCFLTTLYIAFSITHQTSTSRCMDWLN